MTNNDAAKQQEPELDRVEVEAANTNAASTLDSDAGILVESDGSETNAYVTGPTPAASEEPQRAGIWKVRLTLTAKAMLLRITDRRIAGKIVGTIDGLKIDPGSQGTPLLDDLFGYRKLRAVGQRYRVIYTLDEGANTVFVVAIGIRREGSKDDIYELAKKLLRRGLLAPGEEAYKTVNKDIDVSDTELR